MIAPPIKKSDRQAEASAAPQERVHNVIELVLLALSGVCDGAHSQDGQGFNGTDSQFGKSLAKQVNEGKRLSRKQAENAVKILKKYSKQLKGMGLATPTAEDLEKFYPYPYRVEVIDNQIAVFAPYADRASIAAMKGQFCRSDNSYRWEIEHAELINSLLPSQPEFKKSDAFLELLIDCGF